MPPVPELHACKEECPRYLNCMPARKNAPGTVGTGLHAVLDSDAEEPESFTALFFPGPPVLQFFNWIITVLSSLMAEINFGVLYW